MEEEVEARGRLEERGLGIFLDQNSAVESGDETEAFTEHEDAETLEGAESFMEKDEWVWPNVSGDLEAGSSMPGQRGEYEEQDEEQASEKVASRDLEELDFRNGGSIRSQDPEDSGLHGPENAHLYSSDEAESQKHDAAGVTDRDVSSASTATASDSDTASVTDNHPLALEDARPDTPPTSSISQVIFPRLDPQTLCPGGRGQSDLAESLRSRQEQRHARETDWRRMLMEDRAWLVMLFTLYMMAHGTVT